MTKSLSTELREDEIEHLDTFLIERGHPINSFEGLDGLFCALICGPTTASETQYLAGVLGDHPFADVKQAKEISAYMARHWNTVAKTMQRASKVGEVYVPALIVDDAGHPTANAWAEGFLLGVGLSQSAWDPFINGSEVGELLEPMIWLAHEHHDDLAMRSSPLPHQKREDLLDETFDNLMLIYEYFEHKKK